MPITPITSSLAYLTPELPGIGGAIKQRPEDFVVEELPLGEPTGSGEHLWIFIEKRRQTTTDVMRRLAKVFGVRKSHVRYAGLKDKHAITRQMFSIHKPGPADDDARLLEKIQHTPFTLLWAARHERGLKRGQLRGNRFVIHIRHVEPTDVLKARAVLEKLTARGVPNYVGHQRFGHHQQNHRLGRMLLMGNYQALLDRMLGHPSDYDHPDVQLGRRAYEQRDYAAALQHWPKHLRPDRQALDALRQGKSPRDAVMHIESHQREFLITALQSAMFNQVLDQRIKDSLFETLLEGDLAMKLINRAYFAVDAETARAENQPGGRMADFSISPTGPLWGPDMDRPGEPVLSWERRALRDMDLTEDMLAGDVGLSVTGARRPLRVPLVNLNYQSGVDEHGSYVRLGFDLPRGSFATVVLREVMKNEHENPCDLKDTSDQPYDD